MKILVFPQKLIYSGANIVAIDLATTIRDKGHEVVIYAPPGPMEEVLGQRDLPYFEMTTNQQLDVRWPSRNVARELRGIVRSEAVDLVHTYEWPACLETMLGPYGRDGVPLVASIMSMRVERFMPSSIPIVVGTRVLRDEMLRSKYRKVSLIPPSVDVDRDDPKLDVGNFRRDNGISPDTFLVATVSRLSAMKIDSLIETMESVAALAHAKDIRMVVVGGGRLESAVSDRARQLNTAAGREIVLMTGSLGDPRTVYGAVDVVVGMGSSALRGLAFAKPVIVVGTNGYAELFTPETSGEFLVQGFWGLGDGNGAQRLRNILEELMSDPDRRKAIGAFGRRFVEERFSLSHQADLLEGIYKEALVDPPSADERRSELSGTLTRLTAERGLAFIRRRGRRIQQK